MTCNVLVLFTHDSEKLAKELISHFDNVSINAICVDSQLHSHHQPSFQQLSKSKIYVIFFSPDFLKFLENKPLDAYYLCGQLEANSAVAVFCLGLQDRNVLCYHMAPLKCFSSWSKFEVSEQREDDRSKAHVFPQELINRIQEVIAEVDRETVKIEVVPKFLNRNNNVIYLIFSSLITESIFVHLNDSREIEVSPEEVNPYVMRFCVPDSLFQFSHNASVSVATKNHILAKQVIHLSQDSPVRSEVNRGNNIIRPTTKEELFLDEQLKFLTNFCDTTENVDTFHTLTGFPGKTNRILESSTIEPGKDEADFHLRQLCKDYGLEELSILISDPVSFAADGDETLNEFMIQNKSQTDKDVSLRRFSAQLPDMDASYRMDSFLVEETDVFQLHCTNRSLSLPSTLFPTSDAHDSYGQYMDMGGTGHFDMKPHEEFIMGLRHADLERIRNECTNHHSQLSSTLSSERYVSLNWPGENEMEDLRKHLKKGLSGSQQELLDLMQGFKDGECTISNVEKQFQLWTERHSTSNASKEADRVRRTTHEKTGKTFAFALPWRSKPIKKESKQNQLQNKDRSKTNPERQEEQETARKISNTSASSASSKRLSSTSTATISPRGDERNCGELKCDVSSTTFPGWVSTYSPTSNRTCCPLYPEKNPPPLPTRPPPSPKTKAPVGNPTPVPRKKLPVTNANEANRTQTKEDRDTDNPHVGVGSEEDENVNRSIVDLCEKYGFEELGECFISGKIISEKDAVNANEIPLRRHQDSDGYEYPVKPALLTIDGNYRRPGVRIYRRPTSLPPNLNQSGDFSGILTNNTSEERSQVTTGQASRKSCNCENCYSMVDSLTSNVYMTLLEFQRNSCMEGKQALLKEGGLSDSQQELLELMYAFKRGDKTISQVEQQFKEWHARHIGVPASFVIGNSPVKCKHEKNRKPSAFGLPGLKNLIFGKPKKKSSVDNKYPENEMEIPRRKKNSESSNSSHNRLSKISYTSTLSGNSEHSEVFRVNKDNVKSSEGCTGISPSIAPPYPKRPPPMPPIKSVPSPEISPSSDPFTLKITTDGKSESAVDATVNKSRPVPPPKPKLLFKPKLTATTEMDAYPACNNSTGGTLGLKMDDEADMDVRPCSPDYIVPNVHALTRSGWKKQPDAKCARKTEKLNKDDNHVQQPSRNPKVSSKENESAVRIKMSNHPSSQIGINIESTFLNITPAPMNKKISKVEEQTLPQQTLELLKKANLLSCPEDKASRFYIRRSRSYPNLPIYLELLRPDLSIRRSSLFSSNVS